MRCMPLKWSGMLNKFGWGSQRTEQCHFPGFKLETPVNKTMSWDPSQRDGEVLCCCEFWDNKGERNHMLACCCNCQELDLCCERIITCQKVPKTIIWKMFSTVTNRMRFPWRGGAITVSVDTIAPVVLIPLFLLVASHGPWMSVITFSFLPLFLLYAHFLFLKLKPQSTFFISWTITSTLLLLLMLWSVSEMLEIRNDELFVFIIITVAVLCSLYKTKQREGLSLVTENQLLDGGEKCTECNILLPPRAYHCISCNACILKRDQHCAWLNCCIGQYNHFWYMIFLVAVLSQLVFYSNLILTTACHPFRVIGSIMLPDDCSDVYFDLVYAVCFVSSIYCIEGAVFVLSVLVLECWLITLGITGQEYRNRSKRSLCCGLIMSRPYSKGFIRNWLLFWKGYQYDVITCVSGYQYKVYRAFVTWQFLSFTLSRFRDTVADIRGCNSDMLSEEYIKSTFLVAIRDTPTWDRIKMTTSTNTISLTLSQLQDMLMDDEVGDELLNSVSVVGRQSALFARSSSRGRAAGGSSSRRSSHTPAQNRLNARHQPATSSSSNNQPTREGHAGTCRSSRKLLEKQCFKKNKRCYNCDGFGHVVATCPKPKAAQLEGKKAVEMRVAHSEAKRNAKKAAAKPQTLKMTRGHAKLIESRLSNDPNALFAICGARNGPDEGEVWVTIGKQEQAYPDIARLLLDKRSTALVTREGVRPKYFSAIIDSGATEHLANRLEYLVDVTNLRNPRTFKCANDDEGADLVVSQQGNIRFKTSSSSAVLHNVLYSPGLSANLFSVRRVTEKGMHVLLKKDGVDFIDSRTGKVVKQGYFRNNLWWVDFELDDFPTEIPEPANKKFKSYAGAVDSNSGNDEVGGRNGLDSTSSSVMECESTESRENLSVNEILEESLREFDNGAITSNFKPSLRDNKAALWHLRLNHASKSYLEVASKFIPEMKGVKVGNEIMDCEECAEANVVKKSHTQTRVRTDVPFAVLHSDLMGPISPASFRMGSKYILSFICDYSRYSFAYQISNKRQVHLAFSKCLDEITRITKKEPNVLLIRTDGGLEYKTVEMKRLLSKHNVQLVTSPPNTPQLNGCAERFNLELIQKIRVNLLSAKMPHSFWGYALEHVTYVHNRMPNKSNGFISPFEKVHGTPPSLKFLKRFGCLALYVDKSRKIKFAPNGKRSYFLHCGDTEIWLLDELTKTVVRSPDVRCIESQVYGDRVQELPDVLKETLRWCDRESEDESLEPEQEIEDSGVQPIHEESSNVAMFVDVCCDQRVC